MKQYLLFAAWFALNCYAAEHAHAWILAPGDAPSQMVVNGDGAGEVLHFTTPQASFNIVWENINPDDVLTFNDWPTTFYGVTAERVLGADSGELSVTGLLPFTQVRFIPNSPDPGAYFNPSFSGPLSFSFEPHDPAATPEASTWIMLTLGLGLLALPKLARSRAK